MKALSLRQPWADAVLHLGKRIENRRWPTAHRGWFWIHAAQGMTVAEFELAAQFCEEVLDETLDRDDPKYTCSSVELVDKVLGRDAKDARTRLPFGGVVGRARLVDVIQPWQPGALFARAPSASDYPERVRDVWRWHMADQYGFVLEDIQALPARVPCKGSLGFFDLPPDVEAEAERLLAEVTR